MTSATGSGWRSVCQIGVVSRQTNSAIRNHVRYQGSSRLIDRSAASSAYPLNREYAVSNTT